MEKRWILIFEIILVICLNFIAVSVHSREYGACARKGSKHDAYFNCLNGHVVERSKYCNGVPDCYDASDEVFCKPQKTVRDAFSPARYDCMKPTGSKTRTFILCSSRDKCVPAEWKCDGFKDCAVSGDDEQNCADTGISASIRSGRMKAIAWLRSKKIAESATRKWGPLVHKTAVAFYLSDPDFLHLNSSGRNEMTYELSIRLLSKLSQKRIQNIPSSNIASFINALLVTCTDPRDFHGFDLVQELRTRVNKQNSTNPYAYLALCNAGDKITESDVKKLTEMFWGEHRELWTDTQAIALMVLSCARNQSESSVDGNTINELVLELKNRQSRNGSVENLHNSLLVMQALYAAEKDEDPDNFDETKALTYILQNQKSDGSFGSLLLTYYALPVLSCNSLVDINNNHCTKPPVKDEDTAMIDLINHPGAKVRVYYSIWIGVDLDIQRTLVLRVPSRTSFYEIMETAAEIDSKYKFEYIVKDRKPYINALSGIQDDTESGQFWFPYTLKNKTAVPLNKSTADMIPKDEEHIVMWYRPGSWLE